MSDFSELEIELEALRPVQFSAELMARIEHDLAETLPSTATAGLLRRTQRLHWNWLSLGLGIAAAAMFLILARIDGDHSAKQTTAIVSAAPPTAGTIAKETGQLVISDLTEVVYGTRDEGLLFGDDAAEPVRRLRSQTRETLQWRNPSTGASLRVSYPSEEVEFIPISGQ
jgi:hypothetical protein